ncbi:UNVERIFIED_CONTAM: hypothetical protein Slati_0805700 [Sesamum latifolium]|uniref:CCHC-type domain-containing protein n=1 Tax=Sesamum latifolium TaxID=2727402 RepID=A0AAW2XS67_9LAMI
MANLTKLEFIALDVSGTNYLSWVLDAELHLASNKLGGTMKENASASEQDCAKQYRERGFKTYSELISFLLVAEENNQLLLNNHHTRPTGSKPLTENLAVLLEANATSHVRGVVDTMAHHGAILMDVVVAVVGHGRDRGNDRGNHHSTWINPNIPKNNGNKAKNQQEKTTNGDLCHRCGMSGHWSRTCRTAQYLVKLY